MNPVSGLPAHIRFSEVGPRDGLQIEQDLIPTEAKIALIEAIADAGVAMIEVAAFVNPKVVPQMADAGAILAGLTRREGLRLGAFVPNARGAERAIEAGIDDLKCGMAASETFNRVNVRTDLAGARSAILACADAAAGSNARIVGTIGTAFGCPYEGPMPATSLFDPIETLRQAGAELIYLADTSGMADPGGIAETLEAVLSRYPEIHFGLHLHNTRGVGLANALAGLQIGIADFEGSVGGLGGCPFAPRAAGNICSEDFVHMCAAMGIETGIDLDRLMSAAELAERTVGHRLPGMVMKAGASTRTFPLGEKPVKLD